MVQPRRLSQRTLRVIAKRTPELELGRIRNFRKRRRRRWKRLQPLILTMLTGMLAGCRGLAEVEELSDNRSGRMRRALGIGRSVPDTTMRNLACKLDPEELRCAMHRALKKAVRRKTLAPVGLPFGAVAMDGKVTATRMYDAEGTIAQRRSDGSALVRTMTSCLISSAARVCLDMHVIEASANESSTFPAAFGRLLQEFGGLFKVVTYDSGANSRANAQLIRDHDKHYLFHVQAEQPTIFDECKRRLSRRRAVTAHETVDLHGSTVVTRQVWVDPKIAGWRQFPGLQTAIRVRSITEDKVTGERSILDRYYISSMNHREMRSAHWLELVRRHWAVENNCHNTWDRIFREDDRPWIWQPEGMLNVMLLRRIAYNMLSIFKNVSLKRDSTRSVPWKTLMRQFRRAVEHATAVYFERLPPMLEAQVTY